MADQPEVELVLLMREISGGQGGGQFFTLPDGAQLYEKGGYFSENSIFDIFSIRLKDGSSKRALTEPNTIVLSETLQKKLFPGGNAVGKQVSSTLSAKDVISLNIASQSKGMYLVRITNTATKSVQYKKVVLH